MRARLTTVLVLLLAAGCEAGRGCDETCALAVRDGCPLPDMEACETLCPALAAEAETSGCTEAWLDLEYCMGLDPVCAAHSRCAAEREAHAECLRAFCAASPEACEGS